MWLTKEEEKNKPDLLLKENISVNIDKTIEKSSSPSISTEEKELNVVLDKLKDSEDISAVIKTETMLIKLIIFLIVSFNDTVDT